MLNSSQIFILSYSFFKKSRPVIFTPPLRRRNKRYTSGTVHEHDVSGRLS